MYLAVVLIAVALILVLILGVLKLSKAAREIFLVWILEVLMKKNIEEFIRGHNDKLMSPLKETKSTNSERMKRGELLVLEIGVGSGRNFRFYPPGTKLICVDPNRHFKKYFEENRDKYTTVAIERFIFAGGEDLDDLEDESVDVAVATHVFCSVKDIKKVISQVKRVLVKNGKFYYHDHVRAPEGPILWIQILLQPLWKLIGNNCHLTRDIARAMSEAGFSNVEQEMKYLSKAPIPLKYHVFGVATK